MTTTTGYALRVQLPTGLNYEMPAKAVPMLALSTQSINNSRTSLDSIKSLRSLYEKPHLWDRKTQRIDAERLRARLRCLVDNQLPSSLLGCMITLYIMSEEDYRPDGLIDVPMNKFCEKFNVTARTLQRWIKKLESENLIFLIGSTNKRRICVKWDRLQSVPNL